MARYLFLFVFLFVCLVYVLQASPVPEDTPQSNSQSALDDLTNKAKKIFDDAKGALENADFNGALEKARSAIGQATDNFRKEIEKLTNNKRK